MAEEIKEEGLGPISGVCAHFTEKTLNDRGYDKIYRKLLDGEDYRFNQMMERGGIPCELGHPPQTSADFERTETDPTQICCILDSIEEQEDGKVFARGHITDTPTGRVLKAIMPFYTPGFSSRGSYEAVDDAYAEGPDGWNQETYVFKGFDVVLLPATEESRAAMESVGKKSKKIKSAREALDLNELASATDLTPEEVEKELDKLFDDKGEIEGSELVTMKEYVEEKNEEEVNTNEQKSETAVQDSEEIPLEDPIEEPSNPLDSIKNDLETALAEAAKLKQENETAQFNLQNAQAELARVNGELEAMRARAEAAEKTIQDYEQIKDLSRKLLNSYDGVVDEFDSEKAEFTERAKVADGRITELEDKLSVREEELDDTKKQLTSAKEQLNKLTSANESLKKEIKAARESLIDANVLTLGVDRLALSKAVVGKPISQIKGAAESLARDSRRMKGYIPDGFENFAPVESAPKKADYEILDDVDAELMKMFED